MDLRGPGQSGPLGAAFDVATAVDDLACADVFLVGHSFGGYLSQELTFRRSHQVGGLCVIGSTDLTTREHRCDRVMRGGFGPSSAISAVTSVF